MALVPPAKNLHTRTVTFGSLWWVALAVLLVNDHVLKGALLLPGWLTGKLSDVAGIWVAPLLAAALVKARYRRGQRAAFLSVVAVFCAVNLSPQAARALEALVGMAGLSWRIWTDPSDLIALSIVPFAWRRTFVAHQRIERPRSPWLDRLGLLAGSVACIATSAEPTFTTRAYLVNRTRQAIEVRLLRAEADFDCEAIEGRALPFLTRDLFVPIGFFALAPGEVLPLDEQGSQVPFEKVCGAALIQADGMPDTVVFWPSGGAESIPPTIDEDSDLTDNAVIIEGAGSLLRAAAGPPLEIGSPALQAPIGQCSVRSQPIEWSDVSALSGSRQRIESVTDSVDGCVEVGFASGTPVANDPLLDAGLDAGVEDAGNAEAGDAAPSMEAGASNASAIFLCIPRWAFVFQPGERVIVSTRAAAPETETGIETEQRAGVVLTIALDEPDGDGSRLEVTSGADPAQVADIGAVSAIACDATETRCGAIVEPLSVSFDVAPSAPLMPSETRAVDMGYGQTLYLYLGRAERALVARPSCEPALQTAGARVDFLELRTTRSVQ